MMELLYDHDNKNNNRVYLVSVMKSANIFLNDTLSEVELIVEVIDALICWTAHVLVMMLYTQK